jgi:hypothetical protein
VTGIRRQLAARPTPPSQPKLLLADQLIVPGRDGLEVLSLSGLKGIQLIDEHVDGRYLGTLVLFELRSGRREGFVVRNRADGLRAIRALRRARLALEQARRAGDAATLRRLDPLELARSHPTHAPLAPTVKGAEAAPQPSPTEEAEPSSSPEPTPPTPPVTPSPPE